MTAFLSTPMPPATSAELTPRGFQPSVEERRAQSATPNKPVFKRPAGIQLHHLLIAQLDPDQGEYSTADLAKLLGVDSRQIRNRIHQKFGRETGGAREVHRLDFRQAVILIRWVCCDGRKLPDLDQLFCDLLKNGIIDLDFPRSNVAVRMAEHVFAQERTRLLNGYKNQ